MVNKTETVADIVREMRKQPDCMNGFEHRDGFTECVEISLHSYADRIEKANRCERGRELLQIDKDGLIRPVHDDCKALRDEVYRLRDALKQLSEDRDGRGTANEE